MISEQELKQLYNSLTLEEKIGQLLMVPGNLFTDAGELTGDLNCGFSSEELRNVGFVLGVYNGEKLLQIQKAHMKNHRIPILFAGDVTAGYAVSQTMPLAQACTFSPQLVQKMARSTAEAAAAQGIKITFSPMVDISRDARWGRCAESYGEDVFLTNQMSSAMVTGYQTGSPDSSTNLSACVKHFAAYGYPEAGRDYNNVELSERTLLSTFLPPYKAAVDAGCELVMPSFNTIGGVPVTLNPELCKELLRDRWGFRGVTVSDWNALGQCENHCAVNCPQDVARYGMKATVDVAMADNHYTRYIPSILENGLLSEADLEAAVMRVLRLKNKKGLLQDPFLHTQGAVEVDMEKHYAIALEGVEKSCVLLENDGILPLDPTKKIALIGPYAVRDRAYMMWNKRSLPAAAAYRKTPVQALSQALGKSVIAEAGCPLLPAEHFLSATDSEADPCFMNPEGYRNCALEAAAKADIVVMMLGEHPEQTGESASQASLRLPDIQLSLLRQVYQVNPNLVTVVFSGRPVELSPVCAYSRAVMEAWLCGDAGMEGVANLLSGKVCPSGKLAMSFPHNVGQCPIHYDLYPTGHPEKDASRKFTTRYIDLPNGPRYPFGYGKSYTSFTYSPIQGSGHVVTAEEPIFLTVSVSNAGCFDGEEVVQLYLRDRRATLVSRPLRELAGFHRIFLKRGETREVTFRVTEQMLRFYDKDCHFHSEAGEHIAYIGTDSTTENAFSFELRLT